MIQQGQVFKLTSTGSEGTSLWAYRYRVGGRGGKRVQRGGFVSEEDARTGLERALEKTAARARAREGRSPSPSSSMSTWLG